MDAYLFMSIILYIRMKCKMVDSKDMCTLFIGLWVATNDKGGDLNKYFGYKRGVGISKPDICRVIRSDYQIFLDFEKDKNYYKRLELYFKSNFAIITKLNKTGISFKFRSQSWKNIHFFRSKNSEIEFIKLDLKDIFQKLPKKDSILDISISDIFELYGKVEPTCPFTMENKSIYEKALMRHIEVFDLNKNGQVHIAENRVHPFYETVYPDVIKLIVNDSELIDTPDVVYSFLANDKLIVQEYSCETEGCFFTSDEKRRVDTHQITCSDEQIIVTNQKSFGDPENLLEYGVREGYIPLEMIDYRQSYIVTFDIECLETRVEGDKIGCSTTVECNQKIVSLAIGSNLPGISPTFLCRRSSDPEAEQELMDNFLSNLEDIYDVYEESLPQFIDDAIQKLEMKVGCQKFCKERTKQVQLRNHLKRYKKLPVFAFNGGKKILIILYTYIICGYL